MEFFNTRWQGRIFLVLAVVLVVIVGVRVLQKDKQQDSSPEDKLSSDQSVPPTSDALPVPLGSENVGAVYAHYFFSGTLKELKQSDTGLVLTLSTSNTAIPTLPLQSDTRISKITPPYSQATSAPYPASRLRVGQYVEVSVEYDLASHQWLVRDVFLPTDKNTGL